MQTFLVNLYWFNYTTSTSIKIYYCEIHNNSQRIKMIRIRYSLLELAWRLKIISNSFIKVIWIILSSKHGTGLFPVTKINSIIFGKSLNFVNFCDILFHPQLGTVRTWTDEITKDSFMGYLNNTYARWLVLCWNQQIFRTSGNFIE